MTTGQSVIGNNLCAYCINNPVGFVDHSGNKPGDLFDSPQEAAYDAAYYINGKSIDENKEYGTYIYAVEESTYENKTFTMSFWGYEFSIPYRERKTTVKYTYTEPKQGTESNVDLGSPDPYMTAVASFHTHAAYVANPEYSNDYFSATDIFTINSMMLPGYLATPYGALWLYDPIIDIEVMLYTNLPYDPNHPAR